MKTLRIVFTIISALFVATVIPVGVFFSWTYAIASGLIAFAFYLLMLICKQKQEAQDEKRANRQKPKPTDKNV